MTDPVKTIIQESASVPPKSIQTKQPFGYAAGIKRVNFDKEKKRLEKNYYTPRHTFNDFAQG